MTIDPPANWSHADALERGDYPGKTDTAQFKLASLLAEHDDIHTVHHHMRVAGRVLAFLPRICSWQDAEHAPKQEKQLRQSPVAEADDETACIEAAHHHLSGYHAAMRSLAAMGSTAAKDYNPDDRGADEDDARLSQAARDEKAAANAPELGAAS